MTEKEKLEYELALKIGNERFGKQCKHTKAKNGYCVNCLRKIYEKNKM